MTKRKKSEESTKVQKVFTGIWIAVIVLLVPILMMNISLLIRSITHSEEIPSIFGVTPLIAMSGSMEGTIEVGDLVLVRNIEPDAIEKNDVIAFRTGKTVVTHRVSNFEQDSNGETVFVTKGDENNVEDRERVYKKDVVGMYSMSIPKIGDFALFLQTPTGMVLFIAIPFLLYVAYDISRRRRDTYELKRDRAKLESELERIQKTKGSKMNN